jgi:excinuclease ABC subunit B
MYADKLTDSMAQAIDETNRRREKQVAYNLERGVDPQPLRKKIADITDALLREGADTAELLSSSRSGRGGKETRKRAPTPNLRQETGFAGLAAAGGNDLESIIADLNEQMLQAAGELKFELAARLRDEVSDLKKELRQMVAAGHLQ